MGSRLKWLVMLALLSPAVPAAVQVIEGPTPIPRGNARAATDLTVVNEHLAFALAVGTAPPYGVPRGALIDLAPVSAGRIGLDRVVFADFIPNNWSAWPNTYQKVDVLERGPETVRIRAVRDFGQARIETLYTLAAGADRVAISTTMSNEGADALPDLLSGLTLWPSSGFLFPLPGLAGVTAGSAAGALALRVSAYDADWTVTLHAPYAQQVGSGSRDLFLRHTLAPHESRTFGGWLQVGARGDLAPVLEAQIAQQQLAAGELSGSLRGAAGDARADFVVVIEKQGQPYAWTRGRDGHYRVRLPVGQYSLYATARNSGRSAPVPVTVDADSARTVDFSAPAGPGRIVLAVRDARSHAPLDARIVVEAGEQPVVEFLGRRTFFTALESPGRLEVPIAPGPYRLRVTAGGGVLAREEYVAARVRPGATTHSTVGVTRVFDPPARGWYAADLHHHADQAEAVTPPADLARSQLAAGLDLLFVSDHDSTANHAALAALARQRHVPFIPGIELSPSWGHFNAYPLALGAVLDIDTGTAAVGAILAAARHAGASVVQVNHPFIPYGYFSSLAAAVAPGGFDGSFDLMEINSAVPEDDARVLAQLWQYWNQGHAYYLSAGSDTHDVWKEQSGRVRAFAHLDGELSVPAFAAALKAGHAYVSYGPIIYPATMFGTQLPAPSGTPTALVFEVGSVAGLSKVDLIGDGERRASRTLEGAPVTARVSFDADPRLHWYALTVEDRAGRCAYSDPIWLTTPPEPHPP
jgi:hypothetical protein